MPMSVQVARVLVVDDEPQLRELLVDVLAADDVQVETAANGHQAIDLARRCRPDLLVTDMLLGDCTGLDVIDQIHSAVGDIPAVVITGHSDPRYLTEASRRRPVELMTKPLDVERLRATIRQELHRRREAEKTQRRTRRLRALARKTNIARKDAHRQLDTTCSDLTEAYRTLSGQLAFQQVLLDYQRQLLGAKTDDDTFGTLFRFFVQRSGPLFGVAMVCDQNAELRIAGRFGVPNPDGEAFCEALTSPLVDIALANPQVSTLDATDEADLFDPTIRKYVVGLNVLLVPLIPAPGEMIGLVVLYRKGEQPFTDGDAALAELISGPTATAVRRND